MGKSYILTQCGNTVRRLNCLDLKKVHFIHKKKTPALPRYVEQDDQEDLCKIDSPTGT